MSVVSEADLRAQADTARARRAAPAPRRDRASGNHELLIPFTIGPRTCVDRARLYAVSMRIYNVLAQPVSIPTLEPGPGVDSLARDAAGRPLSDLRLPCGRYAARWDGLHVSTRRSLAPGVYIVELLIDRQRLTRKVTLGA
jgi:hypothetical protein